MAVSGWNRGIIEEFRANEGRVGGPFAGRTLLLLHHHGARSGTERVNPLAYQRIGPRTLAVFGSKGGAPTHPDWYHNVIANPRVTVEVGTETFGATARVAGPEEREPIWEQQKRDMAGFADYERRTSRQIPVIIIELDDGDAPAPDDDRGLPERSV